MLLQVSVLVLLFSACFATEEEHTIELTDEDFSSVLRDYEIALVMFYAPWCGHCKSLKPEYEKAAKILMEKDPPVALAKIDCTEAGKTTCQDYNVEGYPTLKIFRNDGAEPQEYNGPRESNGIVKYMLDQSGASSKELLHVEDFEKFIKSDEISVVGFFEKDTPLKEAYFKIAEGHIYNYRFAHCSDKGLLEEHGVTDGIILYHPHHLRNKFEEDGVIYRGPASKIVEFIKKNSHGLVGHRTAENQKDFSAPLVVVYYSIDYEMNAKVSHYWRNRVLKVAKIFRMNVTFAVSHKDDFENELTELGLKSMEGNIPFCGARNSKNEKFLMQKEFSVEALEEFVQNLLAGKLEPYMKSEAIPETNDGPVKIAVARNFYEMVTNSVKDTLVAFYAPWCSQCKKLAPVYEELGEKLVDEDLDIVKMDATENDVPLPYDVDGFPTLYWVPKNGKDKPVLYDGKRNLDDIIKYVAEHATEELKGYDRKGNLKVISEKKTEL